MGTTHREGAVHFLPLGLGTAPAHYRPGADKITLDVRQATDHGVHQLSGAGASVGPQLCHLAKFSLGAHNALDAAE